MVARRALGYEKVDLSSRLQDSEDQDPPVSADHLAQPLANRQDRVVSDLVPRQNDKREHEEDQDLHPVPQRHRASRGVHAPTFRRLVAHSYLTVQDSFTAWIDRACLSKHSRAQPITRVCTLLVDRSSKLVCSRVKNFDVVESRS